MFGILPFLLNEYRTKEKKTGNRKPHLFWCCSFEHCTCLRDSTDYLRQDQQSSSLRSDEEQVVRLLETTACQIAGLQASLAVSRILLFSSPYLGKITYMTNIFQPGLNSTNPPPQSIYFGWVNCPVVDVVLLYWWILSYLDTYHLKYRCTPWNSDSLWK